MLVMVEYSRAPAHGNAVDGGEQLLRDAIRILLVADDLRENARMSSREDDVRRAFAQVTAPVPRASPAATTLAGSIAWYWPKMVSS